MLRHRSTATSRYSSTSRMRTHKQGSTCEQEARIETDKWLPLPRRASATTTTHVRDRSFDERSYKLATLAVERFGHLGK